MLIRFLFILLFIECKNIKRYLTFYYLAKGNSANQIPTNSFDKNYSEKPNLEEILINISSFITDPQSYYVSKQYFEVSQMNKKTEFLNDLISTYLIKKKINIREVEVKLRNEEIKKEKEELKIRKNLEDKIDNALEKANLCLNNIKSYGKITPMISQGQKQIKIKDLEKKEEKDPIDIIVSKIKNKYNEKIIINEENMNDYFFNIAKMRNNFKTIKQKNKNLQSRAKNLTKVFNQIYAKSRKNWKPDNTTDFTFYKMVNFNYVDLLYKLTSIINTELFEKLYLKIIHSNEKLDIEDKNQNPKMQNFKNNNPNEQEYMNTLQDTFSFWYCLKFLLNLIENNQSFKNLSMFLNSINENSFSKNEEIEYSSNDIIKKNNKSEIFEYVNLLKDVYNNKNNKKLFNNLVYKMLGENIQKYLKFLNEKNSNRNSEINENQFFDKRYYTFYEHALLNLKLNLLKLSYSNLSNEKDDFNINNTNSKSRDLANNISKQNLKKFKDLYSIIINNSNYSFSIFKK